MDQEARRNLFVRTRGVGETQGAESAVVQAIAEELDRRIVLGNAVTGWRCI